MISMTVVKVAFAAAKVMGAVRAVVGNPVVTGGCAAVAVVASWLDEPVACSVAALAGALGVAAATEPAPGEADPNDDRLPK